VFFDGTTVVISLLGMLLIGQLFSAALGRATLRPECRIPFHLYVDEFQNFVTDSVASVGRGGRYVVIELEEL